MSARVAVVGAGLAGLAAARRLEAAGADVTVLEEGQRAGGALAPLELEGIRYEPCALALPGRCPALQGLLEDLGLARDVHRTPLVRVRALRRGRVASAALRTRAVTRGFPWRAHRLRSILAWLASEVDPSRPEETTRLDDRSVADFARLYLGRRADPELFAPLLEALFGLHSPGTTRQLLLTSMTPWGDPDFALATGLGALPGALSKGLRDLRAASPVARLRGDTTVCLREGAEIRADAVVLAVPAARALALLPDPTPAERVALGSMRTDSRVHVAVAVDAERPFAEPLAWLAPREGGPLSALLDTTPPGATTGRRVALLAARPGLEVAAEDLIGAAEPLWPGLAARAGARRVHRVPFPRFAPGHYRAVAALRSSPRRGVFLAGAWQVGPHAEGAAASGMRAAEEALRALSR